MPRRGLGPGFDLDKSRKNANLVFLGMRCGSSAGISAYTDPGISLGTRTASRSCSCEYGVVGLQLRKQITTPIEFSPFQNSLKEPRSSGGIICICS